MHLIQRCRGAIAATLLLILAPLASAAELGAPQPLVIGDTLTLASRALAETRRINVYAPPGYAESPTARLPVLVMPDGGIAEDFLHVAGLLQVGFANGTLRPFLLVGIENTQRRRDLTGPTEQDSDRKIAPQVGGSAAFRAFIRDELLPAVAARYRVTDERVLMGESLAGLFVVETWALEPGLFSTYIAFDPSLWWNNAGLTPTAQAALRQRKGAAPRLFLATSSEPSLVAPAQTFVAMLKRELAPGSAWQYQPMPQETHATIYHPAALLALRQLFKPAAAAQP
ncbi:alpha/beta hydrolase-fold protein [Roseateles sp.]|uniref:alpha/beta hydrolase n=1 Tax=Roseateles sp. TaxID=1971397 RepID=UPI0025FDF5CD|nr:alpha/beta hydrolase-fold protein [Roseateles sp.]MBV8034551.1 alpha/beta hydrolase [Roseateles sp.]